MNNPNIKIYLGISLALVVLFILILIIPFSKKTSIQKTTPPLSGQPFPTSIETNPSLPGAVNPTLINIPADFTGVIEETIPQPIIDLAAQKKDLRQKTPLELSTFTITFDYGEDKFIVTLKDPKDQAQKEFESWRTANYPALGIDLFIIK